MKKKKAKMKQIACQGCGKLYYVREGSVAANDTLCTKCRIFAI